MSKASKSNSKVLSTWTPLNNEESNKKVYMERRELFCKWVSLSNSLMCLQTKSVASPAATVALRLVKNDVNVHFT